MRVLGVPARGAFAHLDAGLVHAHDRVGDRVGVGACGDNPVDPVLHQLHGGVVGRRHDDRRGGVSRGLDDHHPVALALGGQQHAQRAAHVGVHHLSVGEARS